MEKPAANTHKCAETQEPGAFAILLEVMPVNKAQSIPLWDEPGLIHHSSGLDAACAAPALWWLPATSEILSHLLLANTDNNKFFTLCHDRSVKFQLFKKKWSLLSYLLLQNCKWIVFLPEDASGFLME